MSCEQTVAVGVKNKRHSSLHPAEQWSLRLREYEYSEFRPSESPTFIS